jgi:NhaP-type Na+/H+ or K+/H+ antiporter
MSTSNVLARQLPVLLAFAAGGIALGAAYFASLRRSLRQALARRAGWRYPLMALTRIAATGLFFAVAVRFSPSALLAAFAGFLAARQLAVIAARRPA